MPEPRVHELESVWARRNKLGNLLLGKVCTIFWMPGIANFIERIDQGILVMGLESNAEVVVPSCQQAGGGHALPLHRDRISCMLHMHDVPSWCEWCRETMY